MIPLVLAFVLGGPARAALLSVKPDDCAALVAHVPDDDVAYRPGVDVRGNKVAPADLNQIGRIDYDTDHIIITIGHPLIAIDGDKSIRVASGDFANALPRLKVGGIVVCDDIFFVPHLERIWHDVIRRDARYVHWQFAQGGFGIAAAVRMSDGPIHARDF